MKSIVNIFTSRRINAANVEMPKVLSVLEFFLRNSKFLARGWKASICGFAKFLYLDVVLKEDSVSLSSWITYNSYSPNVVSQRILWSCRPFVKTDNNPFVSKLLNVESSDIKFVKFTVCRNKLVDFIFWFVLVLHVVWRSIDWSCGLQSSTIHSV